MREQQGESCLYIRGRLANAFRSRQDAGWDRQRGYEVTVMGRLDQRLDGWRDGRESHAEFVPLIGQFIRWLGEDAGVELALQPTQEEPDWLRFGLKVTHGSVGGSNLRLQCALDDLDWITLEQAVAIRKACRQGVAERPPSVAGDSWLLDTKHGRELPLDQVPTYKTAGQRELLRAVEHMPPGEVLMGTLTTGEGKSLVIHRLITRYPQKLTVVVVPTVALAIDQELEAREVVGREALAHPLAYIGGQVQAQAEIRERIADGTQRVVFTCPESLRGLMHVLRKIAQDGALGALVVDEAHVIATDGWQFRPDFAWIPSMCVALSNAATGSATPPRFVLLSATFTQATYEALRRWFEDVGEGEMRVAGSLRLRGEMASIRDHVTAEGASSDLEQREARLERLLPLLPRPFYVYATKREHVVSLAAMLKESGVQRSDQVHGGTSTKARRDIIERLKRAELDAISANSAFGLGLNVSNVRAVVHACVPDGLDRYYQEVGRGGRDGCDALAWWMWCESDLGVAKSQAFARVIKERGFPRWQAMWRNRKRSPQALDCVWVSIGKSENVVTNERHEQWDVCCLVLMEACGLIEFIWDVLRPENVNAYDYLCIRKTTADALVTAEEWGEKVQAVRQRIHDANSRAFQSMIDVLRGRSHFWPALAQAYELQVAERGGGACPALWGDRPSSVPVILPENASPGGPSEHWFVRVDGDATEFVAKHVDCLVKWRWPGAPSPKPVRVIFDMELESVMATLVREVHGQGGHLHLQYMHEEASMSGAHLLRIWNAPTYDRTAWEAERGRASTSLLVLSNGVENPVRHRDLQDALIGLQEVDVSFLQGHHTAQDPEEDIF